MPFAVRSIWTGVLLIALTAAPAVWAGKPAAAIDRIPASAAWVVVIERPGEAIVRVDELLKPFRGLNPDLDLTQAGEKIRAAVGENLLTPDGMRAFGLDPAGSYAMWGPELEGEPIAVLTLADAKLFRQRVFDLLRTQGKTVSDKPQRAAGGAQAWVVDDTRLVCRDPVCLISDDSTWKAKKKNPFDEFFKPGKKIASLPAFGRARAALGGGSLAWFYLPSGPLAAQADRDLVESAKWTTPPGAQKPGVAPKKLAASRKGLKNLFGQLDALAGGLQLQEKTLGWSLLALPSRAGRKAFESILPATGAPAFHADLASGALVGGWSSLNIAALLKVLGEAPVEPGRSMREELDEADRAFRQVTQMGLLADLFSNLKGPASLYLLSPDLSQLDAAPPAEQPPAGQPLAGPPPTSMNEQMMMSLVRVVGAVRVADPVKAQALLSKLEATIAVGENKVESSEVAGTIIKTFQGPPGMLMFVSWGMKGDVVFFGFGEGAAAALARVLPAAPWGKAGGAQRAEWFWDIAAMSEVISTAVSKGIGGEQGTEFRMTWPMIQQVLARLGKVRASAEMRQGDVLFQAVVDLH